VPGILFVNPRAGDGSPSLDELLSAAEALGVRVHVLGQGEDLTELAREADADVLGIAGGDGSLGAVAEAAIERDLPFVCVPWGTRNHFARDIGVPVDDPLRAVAAFRDRVERSIDVGRAAERVFVNNVTLGIYARLVHRRESRRRRREAFARLRALLISLRDRRWSQRFVIDGRPVRASVIVVANNAYRLDLLSIGERERVDEGRLAIYAARGLRRLRWQERSTRRVRIETRRNPMRAAVDGEPALLESPLELWVEPGALRLLLPGEDDHAKEPPSRALEDE
jgi:diacylglycerol kinase family enzyme